MMDTLIWVLKFLILIFCPELFKKVVVWILKRINKEYDNYLNFTPVVMFFQYLLYVYLFGQNILIDILALLGFWVFTYGILDNPNHILNKLQNINSDGDDTENKE